MWIGLYQNDEHVNKEALCAYQAKVRTKYSIHSKVIRIEQLSFKTKKKSS